ncbi:hypothetical protein GF357_00840, partial [Candidatus Dojkabacteria bacterium]|nr:hypothetical protein [Candidatus Dojkabacteria bacterium]
MLKKLQRLLQSGNTLFYPGCLTKYKATNFQENYERILRHLNIDFITIPDFNCCGSPVLNTGTISNFRKLARKNLKQFNDYAVNKIITGCPACYKIFTKDYAGVLKKDWDIEVEHVSQTIAKLLAENQIQLTKIDKSITYHDPCHLGRHTREYQAPRKILKAITDDYREMKLTKEYSMCCGAGGGVSANFPERASRTATDRILQAKETKADILVTTCPMCDLQLFHNAAG